MIGQTILHYKILEKLGEGGMGEVFKAQDTKLDRFVALKFLPSQLTASEDEKARFLREAKAASSMNHPNICTIYSIEEFNNQLFISMEFVEGKTLKDFVGTGHAPSLRIKDIIEYGIQVAEGLAAAHEKGIVHRDIKPENIMIRKDGIAQIMDFGLAKLYSDKNASRLTKVGTTMGTLGYMSPEQVQGQDVDHRTDIFSLGVVLYEMFAGESPFKGMHETAIMYEIVNVEVPPMSTIKEGIDPELDEIILECLEKDKDDRYQSAKELAKDLRKVKKSTGHRKSRVYNVNSKTLTTDSSHSQVSKSSGSIAIEAFNKRFELAKIIPVVCVLALIAASVFAFLFFNKTKVPETGIIQFSVSPPEGTKFTNDTPVISPDGKTLAFTAIDSTGKSNIWLRPLESIKATLLAGTEKAGCPFWSFDSRYLGFFSNGKLNKINLSTGTIQTLCDATEGYGGTWSENNLILFTPAFFSQIFRIDAGGGVPVQATYLDKSLGEENHFREQFLPDGHHFIYSAFSRNAGNSNIYIGSIDDGSRTRIMGIDARKFEKAEFVSPDYLFFTRNNSLMVQKFDPSNFKLQSDPQLVATSINDFTVSNNVLVTLQKPIVEKSYLILYDRQGKQLEINDTLGLLIEMSMSPDENSMAYHRIYGPGNEETFNQDIWILNRQRDLTSRFTFEAAADVSPLWSSDGKSIVYASSPDSVYDIYEKSISGNDKPELLLKTNFNKTPLDWSSDGKYILYYSERDLWILPMFGDHKPFQYLHTNYNESAGVFSPDCRWIAYCSNESGRDEVYIQSFPHPDQKYQISTNGASSPRWQKDGKELYYVSSDNKLMTVEIKTAPKLTIGTPIALFKADLPTYVNMYLVLNNGKNFLVNSLQSINSSHPLQVIVNWKSLLNVK